MTTWLTSDEHYDHKNIIPYCNRPFHDLRHMRESMIAKFNEVEADGDVVYHLGDFSLDEKTVELVLPQLNGEHHLICGNHDKCHPHHRNNLRMTVRYLEWGFRSVALVARIGPFLATHMPYLEHAGDDVRYPEWRPTLRPGASDERLLHGHIHNLWKTKANMINVGVDVWDYKPVALDTLTALQATTAG